MSEDFNIIEEVAGGSLVVYKGLNGEELIGICRLCGFLIVGKKNDKIVRKLVDHFIKWHKDMCTVVELDD